jgi:excisionase family DNA binding protein
LTAPVEVTVTAADYWASRPHELAQLLSTCGAQGKPRTIADPSGRPPNPDRFAVITAPGKWSAYLRELQEALSGTTPTATGQPPGAGAIAPVGERLTLTVEEAGTLLGISRAFAYEAVNRGDIPSIRIGRRILIPKAALHRLMGVSVASENNI